MVFRLTTARNRRAGTGTRRGEFRSPTGLVPQQPPLQSDCPSTNLDIRHTGKWPSSFQTGLIEGGRGPPDPSMQPFHAVRLWKSLVVPKGIATQ